MKKNNLFGNAFNSLKDYTEAELTDKEIEDLKAQGYTVEEEGEEDPLKYLSYTNKFESGKKGSRAIGYDEKGGTSYGTIQLASNTGAMQSFIKYLANSQNRINQEIAKDLMKVKNWNTGSIEGDAVKAWNKIVDKYGDDLYQAEKNYADKMYTKPVVDFIKREYGLEPNQIPDSLKAAVASRSIQHGEVGAKDIIRNAWKDGIEGKDEFELMKSLYDEVGNNIDRYFAGSSKKTRESVRNRMQNEPIAVMNAIYGQGYVDNYLKEKQLKKEFEERNKLIREMQPLEHRPLEPLSNFVTPELSVQPIQEPIEPPRNGLGISEWLRNAHRKRYKFENGGNLYSYNGNRYQKSGDKWLKEVNGKFVPMTKGNVQQRYNVLNKNAKPIELSTEDQIDKWLGYPMKKATQEARINENGRVEDIDNIRHAASGAYTAQALKDKGLPGWAAALGSMGLGAAHEAGTFFTDPRWKNDDSFYNKFTGITREALEDIYNNGYGVYQWATSPTTSEATDNIWKASSENRLADGVAYRDFGNQTPNLYFKNDKGQGGFYKKFSGGGKVNDSKPVTYTYPSRPGVRYQKGPFGWTINIPGQTNGYVPIKDPTGKRTAELNKNAIPAQEEDYRNLEYEKSRKSSEEARRGITPIQASNNTTLLDMFSVPQNIMMAAATNNEHLTPSSYLQSKGINNPVTNTVADIIVDPLNVVGALGATGELKNIKNNAWRINPGAYQYNVPENVMLRGIGEAGMKDALESGVFRPRPAQLHPEKVTDGPFLLTKNFNKTYYSPDLKVVQRYSPTHIAEVPKDAANFTRRYKGKDWSQFTNDQIPIDQGRILEQDWWKGYKPIDNPNLKNTSEPIKAGVNTGMDMSKHQIKNVNYYQQLLDKGPYNAGQRKYIQDVINSVKKQDGLATQRQLNYLNRLKTGNFNFGPKGYAQGGKIEVEREYEEKELTPEMIQWYRDQGFEVEESDD